MKIKKFAEILEEADQKIKMIDTEKLLAKFDKHVDNSGNYPVVRVTKKGNRDNYFKIYKKSDDQYFIDIVSASPPNWNLEQHKKMDIEGVSRAMASRQMTTLSGTKFFKKKWSQKDFEQYFGTKFYGKNFFSYNG